mmetsp:Transcript_124464/g.175622  ORF Transcript_124464/g.175622 Transcript_124464/m.175622 type:complete len:204 (+) Transcript_124464:54-665(+)
MPASDPPLFCDWTPYNAKAGACWDCCKTSDCEPCCGEPCNFMDGLYCFCCFLCCYTCVKSKWWASQVDQDCACVNHCLIICGLRMLAQCGSIYMIPWILFETFFRRNSRLKNNVGVADDPMNIFGDCFMSCCPCTAPCTECQELRTVPVSDWDWLGQMRSETGFVGYLPDWELFPVDENRRNSATNATPNDAMLEHDDSAKHV